MNIELLNNDDVKMAKADLFKLGKYSVKLFKMMHEGQDLDAWVQAKITKAADYISSVYHYMEYEMKISDYGEQLDNSDVYAESIKAGFQQKLMEARAEQNLSLMETVYDKFVHPKLGNVEWINYEGVHMIAKIEPGQPMVVYTIGNSKEIAENWKKFKASAKKPGVKDSKAGAIAPKWKKQAK